MTTGRHSVCQSRVLWGCSKVKIRTIWKIIIDEKRCCDFPLILGQASDRSEILCDDFVILHWLLGRQVIEARAHLLQQLDSHPDRLAVAHCCAIFLFRLGGEIFDLVGQLTRLAVHIIPATLFSLLPLGATYLGWVLILKDYNSYAICCEPKSPD